MVTSTAEPGSHSCSRTSSSSPGTISADGTTGAKEQAMVDWKPLKRWLFTTNHKDIGILYLLTSLYFFVTAVLFALPFRFPLAVPSNTFPHPDDYHQLVTTH